MIALHARITDRYRSCLFLAGVVLLIFALTGKASAAEATYDFANLGVVGGDGFKPQGNRFLVNSLFEQEAAPNDTTIYYNDLGSGDVSGITIKADGVNLISFDLTDMDFIHYTGQTVTSITITGTKTGGGTVTTTINPGAGAANDHFTLTGKSAVLTNFTSLTQLQFRVVISTNVACLDFASITVANEIHEVITRPTVQASAVQAYKVGQTEMALNWTKGNGNSRVVFAKQGVTSGAPILSDSATYTSNADFSSATDPDGDGWKCVYSGNADYALVSGLSATTQYRFAVFEYNGYGGAELYLTTNPATLNQSTTAGSLGTWTMGDIQTLNAENFWTWTDADRDSSGNTYVSHRYSGAGMQIKVEKWDGASWSTLSSFVLATGGYSNFNDSAMAVPPGTTDQVRVAVNSVVGGASWGITEATYNGTAWSFRNADYTSTSGYYYSTPVIAVGSNGNSHILYEVTHSPVQEIRLASWNGSAWGVQTLSSIAGYGSSNEVKKDYLLLIDSSNIPHVFYFRETSANTRDLLHWSNGTTTTITTGITDAPYKLYGAVNSSGKFHVTYTVDAFLGRKVMYVTNKTGPWVTLPLMVSTSGSDTGFTALELRVNGNGDMAIPLREQTGSTDFKVLLKQGSNPWQVSAVSPSAPDWEDAGFGYNVTGATFREDGKVLIAYANDLSARPGN